MDWFWKEDHLTYRNPSKILFKNKNTFIFLFYFRLANLLFKPFYVYTMTSALTLKFLLISLLHTCIAFFLPNRRAEHKYKQPITSAVNQILIEIIMWRLYFSKAIKVANRRFIVTIVLCRAFELSNYLREGVDGDVWLLFIFLSSEIRRVTFNRSRIRVRAALFPFLKVRRNGSEKDLILYLVGYFYDYPDINRQAANPTWLRYITIENAEDCRL